MSNKIHISISCSNEREISVSSTFSVDEKDLLLLADKIQPEGGELSLEVALRNYIKPTLYSLWHTYKDLKENEHE